MTPIYYCGASEAEHHFGITSSVVRPSVRLSVRLSHFWFAHNFLTLRDRTFIFGMCVPYDKMFPMITHVTLTVTFDLHFENVYSAHYFLTIRHRAFILGRCVPYHKTLPMIL